MSRRAVAIAALFLGAILFLAVNTLAGSVFRGARLDLTEDKEHTLSAGTLSTLAKLDEPIRLKLYYSARVAESLPQISAYGSHVRDLLAEYKAHAGSKLIVEVIDPDPYSQEEDDAAQAGLHGLPVQDGETLYFGIVGTNQRDGREVIPFLSLDRQNFLEYDLTRLIANLNQKKKPIVGLMSSLPLALGPGGVMAAMRGQSHPYGIYEELSKQFDLRSLTFQADKIDSDVKVLMLVQPPPLEPKTQFALDQFVLRGGRLLVLTDPFSEIAAQAGAMMGRQQPSQIPESATFEPFFAKWGVELVPGKIVADRKLAQRVTFMDQGQQRQMGYVGWLKIGESEIDRQDVVTAQLKSLNFASAGALKPIAGAKTSFKPLITSSDDAMLIGKEQIANVPDPIGLMRDFKPSGERYVLAARISGPVETAFPDGRPKSDQPPPKDEEPPLKASKGPINVIVIADTDLLDDKFWLQTADLFGQRIPVPTADNGNLIIGAIDNLTGSSDVISLRARPPIARSFTRVDQMRISAEERFLAEEKRLQDQLAETERRLSELQVQGKGSSDTLSPAQLEEINAFQRKRAETRRALREVQHKLNQNIETLGLTLKILNIALVPVGLAIFALGLSIWKSRRREMRIRALKAA